MIGHVRPPVPADVCEVLPVASADQGHPHVSESGVDRHNAPSVAPRGEQLNRMSRSGSSTRRRDGRVMMPPMAPASWRAEATPFMTSTCHANRTRRPRPRQSARG